MKTEDLLKERAKTHGNYEEKTKFIQYSKEYMRNQAGWNRLGSDEKESLDMIETKIGRILYGKPMNKAEWEDIAGYATLIIQRMESDEQLKSKSLS